MVRHTLKILQQLLQDFLNVSDHFGKLCINGLPQLDVFIVCLYLVENISRVDCNLY